MAQAFGIVSFAGNNIRVGEMQNYRPVGAVSFLGRYRVIDFPISNMSNSEIEHIQVYVRRKPRSLTEHLGTGRTPSDEHSTTSPSSQCQFDLARILDQLEEGHLSGFWLLPAYTSRGS